MHSTTQELIDATNKVIGYAKDAVDNGLVGSVRISQKLGVLKQMLENNAKEDREEAELEEHVHDKEEMKRKRAGDRKDLIEAFKSRVARGDSVTSITVVVTTEHDLRMQLERAEQRAWTGKLAVQIDIGNRKDLWNALPVITPFDTAEDFENNVKTIMRVAGEIGAEARRQANRKKATNGGRYMQRLIYRANDVKADWCRAGSIVSQLKMARDIARGVNKAIKTRGVGLRADIENGFPIITKYDSDEEIAAAAKRIEEMIEESDAARRSKRFKPYEVFVDNVGDWGMVTCAYNQYGEDTGLRSFTKPLMFSVNIKEPPRPIAIEPVILWHMTEAEVSRRPERELHGHYSDKMFSVFWHERDIVRERGLGFSVFTHDGFVYTIHAGDTEQRLRELSELHVSHRKRNG